MTIMIPHQSNNETRDRLEPSKGFGLQLPSRKEIQAVRVRFLEIVRTWRLKKIQTIHAYLNALLYRGCSVSGGSKRVRRAKGSKKGFHFVGGIAEMAKRGLKRFNVSIQGVVDQLSNFWGIKISEVSLRKYRYELRDRFDLFDWEPAPLGSQGCRNSRRPNPLIGFDLVTACLLIEALETVLVRDYEFELDQFPGRGAMPRLVYNDLFRGIARFRRVWRKPASTGDLAGAGSSSTNQETVAGDQEIEDDDDDPIVFYQGNRFVRASEMDWSDPAWTESGRRAWFGEDTAESAAEDAGGDRGLRDNYGLFSEPPC